ncbi:MAG: hypothetical protein AB4038_02080, partial [Prochloraceae cyanobacterium]
IVKSSNPIVFTGSQLEQRRFWSICPKRHVAALRIQNQPISLFKMKRQLILNFERVNFEFPKGVITKKHSLLVTIDYDGKSAHLSRKQERSRIISAI